MRGLQTIFGSKAAERVLLYMQNYGDGYGLGIAKTFGMPVSQITKQLEKLEEGGILVSSLKGRTRLYVWNDRNPLVGSLRSLLEVALDLVPDEDTERYYRQRSRPRRAGKPL